MVKVAVYPPNSLVIADLIERKAKNTGKIWYGCSKFPKCKRTYFPQDDGSIKEAVKK